jgi:hypothetical protein
MTRSLLILLVFCFGISAESLADEIVNFAGSWDAPSSDVSAFSLDLTQTGNRIRGYHTAIAHRGKRIDAVLPSEGPPSITGIVTGGVAHIKFRSGYNDTGSGEALLTFRGNKLEWKITKSSGAHYFPESSVLFRQKRHQTKSPNHAMQRRTYVFTAMWDSNLVFLRRSEV